MLGTARWEREKGKSKWLEDVRNLELAFSRNYNECHRDKRILSGLSQREYQIPWQEQSIRVTFPRVHPNHLSWQWNWTGWVGHQINFVWGSHLLENKTALHKSVFSYLNTWGFTLEEREREYACPSWAAWCWDLSLRRNEGDCRRNKWAEF